MSQPFLNIPHHPPVTTASPQVAAILVVSIQVAAIHDDTTTLSGIQYCELEAESGTIRRGIKFCVEWCHSQFLAHKVRPSQVPKLT